MRVPSNSVCRTQCDSQYRPEHRYLLITICLAGGIRNRTVCINAVLFYTKIVKNVGAVRTHNSLHRYACSGAVLIFAIHTVSAGYTWSRLLFIAFIGVAVTGLLNPGIVRFNRNSKHKLWLWVHISLAGVLMPLSVFHAYVSLAFE